MKQHYFFTLGMLFILFIACKSNKYVIREYDNIPGELISLSSFESNIVEETETTVYYDELNLKKIVKDKTSEFWIENKKILEIANDPQGICSAIEIFKENFLLISKDDCSRSVISYVKRNDVLFIDLNSTKLYKVDFGSIMLTFSKQAVEQFFLMSDNMYFILNVDLDNSTIKIKNYHSVVKTVNLIEITKSDTMYN